MVVGQLQRRDRRQPDLTAAGEAGPVPRQREPDASTHVAPEPRISRASWVRCRWVSADASAAASSTSEPPTLSRSTWPVGVASPST